MIWIHDFASPADPESEPTQGHPLPITKTSVFSPLPCTAPPTSHLDAPKSREKLSGSESVALRRPWKPNMGLKSPVSCYQSCKCCIWNPSMGGDPWWLRWSRICLQCRRPGFNPWVRKIPWRREWQPTPGFLPGECHGEKSLAGCNSWGRRESDMTEWLTCLFEDE